MPFHFAMQFTKIAPATSKISDRGNFHILRVWGGINQAAVLSVRKQCTHAPIANVPDFALYLRAERFKSSR